MTTICFVGPSAYTAVDSAITLFRHEFEAKLIKRTTIPVTAVSEEALAVGGGA
jgi:NADH-quinone oxidoreductase subunit F